MSDASEPIFEDEDSGDDVTQRQIYNIATDTITGPNVRLKDNVIQAIVIFICLVLGAIIGAFLVEERAMGILAGGFVGLLVGLFGSGIFLMIYRAVMHMRGRHD